MIQQIVCWTLTFCPILNQASSFGPISLLIERDGQTDKETRNLYNIDYIKLECPEYVYVTNLVVVTNQVLYDMWEIVC